MPDDIKTGPGVHPSRQTKTEAPTRRSLFGLSSAKSKGELTVPKQSSAVSEFLHKADSTPHKTERAVQTMLSKPQSRREALNTGKNAVAAARMAGKVKLGKTNLPNWQTIEDKKGNVVHTIGKYMFDRATESWRPAKTKEEAEKADLHVHGFKNHEEFKRHRANSEPVKVVYENGESDGRSGRMHFHKVTPEEFDKGYNEWTSKPNMYEGIDKPGYTEWTHETEEVRDK